MLLGSLTKSGGGRFSFWHLQTWHLPSIQPCLYWNHHWCRYVWRAQETINLTLGASFQRISSIHIHLKCSLAPIKILKIGPFWTLDDVHLVWFNVWGQLEKSTQLPLFPLSEDAAIRLNTILNFLMFWFSCFYWNKEGYNKSITKLKRRLEMEKILW